MTSLLCSRSLRFGVLSKTTKRISSNSKNFRTLVLIDITTKGSFSKSQSLSHKKNGRFVTAAQSENSSVLKYQSHLKVAKKQTHTTRRLIKCKASIPADGFFPDANLGSPQLASSHGHGAPLNPPVSAVAARLEMSRRVRVAVVAVTALLAGLLMIVTAGGGGNAAWAMGGGALPKAKVGEAVAKTIWDSTSKAEVMAHLSEVSFQLVAAVVNIFFSAFFSLSETSITTLWPWKVRELAEKEGEGNPFKILERDITRFLTTILIGATCSQIAATAFVTDAGFKLLGEAGVGYVTLVLTGILLVFCEIMPKSIAVVHAAAIARFVIPTISFFSVVLYPIGYVCKAFTRAVLAIFNVDASSEPFVSEEELKLVLSGAAQSGSLRNEESEMISSVLNLEDTPVREIMTPLVDVVAVPEDLTLDQMRTVWHDNKFSRVPVFRERIDNIVGIMHCYDMIRYTEDGNDAMDVKVGDMMEDLPFFIPDNMTVWNLLREFRIRNSHMSVVVNEYGGTVGICTLEDAVEEIVGEIYDETDSPDEVKNIIFRGKGVYDVDAKTPMAELISGLQLQFPPGNYETVAGYVSSIFGCIPEVWQATKIQVPEAKQEFSYSSEDEEDKSMSGEVDQMVALRVTVTGGNKRKLYSVRFERLLEDGTDMQSGTPGLPRVFEPPTWSQEIENFPQSPDTAPPVPSKIDLDQILPGSDEKTFQSGDASADDGSKQEVKKDKDTLQS